MSATRVTEISAASPLSFEEAINRGLDLANESLHGIERAWMKEMKVVVKGGRVEEYRICMKLTSVDN